MTTTNPIEIDGKQYDRYSLNITLLSKYEHKEDLSMVLTLTPTCIENGEVHQAPPFSHIFGTLELADADQLVMIESIKMAVQKYIISKSL